MTDAEPASTVTFTLDGNTPAILVNALSDAARLGTSVRLCCEVDDGRSECEQGDDGEDRC